MYAALSFAPLLFLPGLAHNQRQQIEPLVPGVSWVPPGDVAALATALREARPAAIMLEPIQGEAGVVVPPRAPGESS